MTLNEIKNAVNYEYYRIDDLVTAREHVILELNAGLIWCENEREVVALFEDISEEHEKDQEFIDALYDVAYELGIDF